MKKETVFRRRKEIFEAALTVFSKKGFDKATLDEIADRVKISKPAIYLYFKNKEILFFSMVEDKMSTLSVSLADIKKSDAGSIDKLKALISANINFYINNKEFFKIVHQTRFRLDNKGQTRMQKNFKEKYGGYISGVEKLINQCIKDGYLKDRDSLFLTFALMGIMTQSVFGAVMLEKTSYLKDVDSKIIELFLEGAGK